MSGWAAKRFWKAVSVAADGAGFEVRLDARAVKTPAKRPLILPTRAMAEAIAAEWAAQEGVIRPEGMPFTRAANSAIDKVAPQFGEVAGLIAAYGDADLICYRATGPEALIARQKARWDPLVEWSAAALGAPLLVASGVMHIAQAPATLARLQAAVRALSPFELAAFHDLVAITGSLVLAFAIIRGRLTAEEAWSLSRIDEEWQAELWGRDEEAAAAEALKRAGLLHSARFYGLCS